MWKIITLSGQKNWAGKFEKTLDNSLPLWYNKDNKGGEPKRKENENEKLFRNLQNQRWQCS